MLLPSSDTRVVELRVHGIMGTRAETLVGAATAVDVAGDGIGRIVRPADRLLRPGPGPLLQAGSRSVPRVVEGYVWGGMTSGGVAKSLWALVFPFTLANVAHWMLPPIPEGNRTAAALGLISRSLLRLAALLLTVLFVTQVAVVSLDLIAAQCLAPGSPCLSGLAPDWMRELRGFRPAVGLIPALIVVLLLDQISAVSWHVNAPPTPSPIPGNRPQRMPGANLVADPDTPTLRSLHTIAALSVLALLPAGGPFATPAGTLQWAVALTLLVFAALGVLLLDDPTGSSPHRAGRWLRIALGKFPRRVLLLASVALVIGTAVAQNPLPDRLSGTDITIEGVAAALIVVCVLFGLVLIPAALIARKALWADDPRELRPWAGGWMSPVLLAIAALLGGGFGAGIAITIRKLVGSTEMDLPRGYEPVTLLWGVSAVLFLAIGVLLGLATAGYRWRPGNPLPEVDLLHENADDLSHGAAASAWRRARFQRNHFHHLLLGVGAVLGVGAGVSIWMRLRDVGAPQWMQPFSTLGIFALGLLAANLMRVIYQATRKPDTARTLGILADLACFWPREAHPVVPPCYALKVIPELAERAAQHLADRNTRVVITGHSHGSLIARSRCRG